MKFKLDNRLLAVAACVPRGAFLADVGTDHAYLPIHLAQMGHLAGAVASDINKGPLESAKKNIEEANLSHLIRTELTDGLVGLEKYPLTDVAIAGMGGLMIADILKKAPFLHKRGIRLILQPMQHVPELRQFLAASGYLIEKETQTVADGKFYQILCAVHNGTPQELTELEALLGAYNLAHKYENKENFTLLCRRQLDILGERVRGMEKGGRDASAPRALIERIEAELADLA
jgi:tRNA (adenine22-N1)-methyltransferase